MSPSVTQGQPYPLNIPKFVTPVEAFLATHWSSIFMEREHEKENIIWKPNASGTPLRERWSAF